jgi:dinuclear metal center YbgI/SA1388 family protein
MTPAEAVARLEELVPLTLAAGWDRVGLLVEGARPIRSALLCIDATPEVLTEAEGFDLLIAYHPPLFGNLERLVQGDPAGARALALARSGLTVWSPHSALDALAGGVTDWLIEPLGPFSFVEPLVPDRRDPLIGMGRMATLERPTLLASLLTPLKAHLGASVLQVASPPGLGPIRTVAACPGAGGSLIGPTRADLLLTGEWSHHHVLAALARGQAVVLADHSTTERGFLTAWRPQVEDVLGLPVRVARQDRAPLRWV